MRQPPDPGATPVPVPFLREFLAETDCPCPGCGYNLRGLRSERCPECNQELVLRVGLTEPRMRLWLAGAIGLAFGTGLNGLLLVYVVIVAIFISRPLGDLGGFVLHNTVGLLVEGVPLALVIAKGALVRRWSEPARWGLCVGAWILTAVNVVVFALTVR